jgi:hypothetical protein
MAKGNHSSLNSTVLFDLPQSQIGDLLNHRILSAAKIGIITGFATVEGIKALKVL